MMANPFHIGITMSVMSLTTAATSSQIGRISKKYKSRNILLTGVSFYIGAMILLAEASSWIMIISALLIFGFGQGLFIPTVQTMLVGFAPMKERAAFMSLNSMVLRIGQTTGPLVMGIGFAIGGLSCVYYGGAVFAVIMFLILQIMIKESKRDSKHH
jgi:MFS family permease